MESVNVGGTNNVINGKNTCNDCHSQQQIFHMHCDKSNVMISELQIYVIKLL